MKSSNQRPSRACLVTTHDLHITELSVRRVRVPPPPFGWLRLSELLQSGKVWALKNVFRLWKRPYMTQVCNIYVCSLTYAKCIKNKSISTLSGKQGI